MSARTRAPYPRGSIVIVQLEPVVGSEQGKARPCVVTSDARVVQRSRAKLLYTVVPLTHAQTLVGPLAPRLEARKGGLPSDGVALVMHVRTVDPRRVLGYVGELSADEYTPVREGLAVLFGLRDGTSVGEEGPTHE